MAAMRLSPDRFSYAAHRVDLSHRGKADAHGRPLGTRTAAQAVPQQWTVKPPSGRTPVVRDRPESVNLESRDGGPPIMAVGGDWESFRHSVNGEADGG